MSRKKPTVERTMASGTGFCSAIVLNISLILVLIICNKFLLLFTMFKIYYFIKEYQYKLIFFKPAGSMGVSDLLQL